MSASNELWDLYEEQCSKLMKLASKIRVNLQFSSLGIDHSTLKKIDELRGKFASELIELNKIITLIEQEEDN